MIIIFYVIALNVAILILAYYLVEKHNAIVELENEIAYYNYIISGLRNELITNKAMHKN